MTLATCVAWRDFRDTKAPSYSINNAASTGLYDRVAYYMELDGTYVYASMDAFNLNASQIGLPHNVFNALTRQQVVNNMNVYSNAAGVTTGTGIATGGIEMWPSNYGGNSSGYVPTGSNAFDWNDSGFNTGAGHSSFQIHNTDIDGVGAGTAGETILAYNRYGHSDGNPAGVGIGNRPAGDTDWTFAQNAGTFTTSNLQILVREVAAPDLPATLQDAPAQIVANAPEASDYKLVYQLPINNTTFDSSQYVVNDSALVPDGSFDRVGYYVELESTALGSQFVWVSMDAFNLDADLIGIPDTTAAIQQMIVENMNVLSDVASITDIEGTQGNIEFWNTNYGNATTTLIPGGAAGTFDFNDARTTGGSYGSFQIHNFGLGETLLGYNRWNDGITSDLGIGNQPSGNPDWTFAGTASAYTVKNFYVLVAPPASEAAPAVPEPASIASWSIIGLCLTGFGYYRRRRKSKA